MSKKTLTLSVLATSAAMATGLAHSAAFQLAEQSTSGLGRAYAGEGAAADNAAVLGRNPAAMTLFHRPALSAGAVYVNPEIDVEGKPTQQQAAGASQAGLPTQSNDIADDAVVPFFYYVQPINAQWAAGIGAFTNYGLSTSYQDNHYAGPVAGKTALTTLNLNPNIAYRMNRHLSLGAGFNAVYADAELIRHKGIASLQPPPQGFGGNATDEVARLVGDDWGYGWNIGLLLEADEHNRWALTYRSEIDLTMAGDYSGINTGGQPTPATLDLTLPAIAELSGFHQVNPEWALHYGLMWTEWSSFEELKAISNDPRCTPDCFQKDEKFKNSWRVSAGVTHLMNDQWILRGGLAYDQSPVPAATRSISIPDVDRTWYTLGATFAVNQALSLDAALAFLHGGQVEVNETPYQFTSGGDAWLLGLQMNYQF
ncbi:long-chain fatty acid transport protein [Oceanimonas sp. GK1]|uniref:outer membrane protein transport protein n=1 Tax=Oceanimonas sp. (strain GK1 / IBRC-M 10197) TaxID=511062 RepID=UPI0002495660|nr:outer membrane protein transport protein [Oceanimonas sp. GK1]AEY02085.1 long-chain fatty acid transport protein [Oceanimonas sp. GK1]